ncbi:hypothetical protein GT037_002253 [Alternaria burnsii]|uniref:Uncharacterized protein n=1 Tax=Alternaria burnsii TaxID=1187904 RepID=A0A8H7BF00_9PLEO|nr:uncharacterized protein GT037_002253 [Alternaria burnsii]KAF7680602.1 hypothetical protein GT037_002253 [Alternaria burnsii]
MRDSIKCFHHDEVSNTMESCTVDDNQIQSSHPSTWRSRIRAATDSFAYPLPPSSASTETPHSGVYMPSGPFDRVSGHPTSHYRPEAPSNPASNLHTSHYRPQGLSTLTSNHSQIPSNPFEDPQYVIGVTVPKRRPMREWQDVLEDQRSDASAHAVKLRYGKVYLRRQRSRVQAVFTSAKKTDCESQQRAASTLLKGQGTHLGRDTMRGLQCPDCRREMEARSLAR